MNAAILQGTLALVTACVFLAVSAAVFLTRRNLRSALQAFGLGCLGVMALTHVLEAFADDKFLAAGSGEPLQRPRRRVNGAAV